MRVTKIPKCIIIYTWIYNTSLTTPSGAAIWGWCYIYLLLTYIYIYKQVTIIDIILQKIISLIRNRKHISHIWSLLLTSEIRQLNEIWTLFTFYNTISIRFIILQVASPYMSVWLPYKNRTVGRQPAQWWFLMGPCRNLLHSLS